MKHNIGHSLTDTLWEVETPEGIMLRLRPAGFAPRGLAWLMDFGIRLAVVAAISFTVGLTIGGYAAGGIILVVSFLLEWLYPVVFEVCCGGQTPGKKRLNLRVLHDNGTPVGWPASLVRNLLRFLDLLTLYSTAAACMLMDGRHRRLGDLAAGTLVVHVEPELVPRLPSGEAPEAPAHPLDLEERAALVAFAERLDELSQARQVELAELLQPLHGRKGWQAVQTLRRNAAHLLGDS